MNHKSFKYMIDMAAHTTNGIKIPGRWQISYVKWLLTFSSATL